MTKTEAQALAERLLSCATADHTEIGIGHSSETAARFANNAIIQSVHNVDRGIAVTSAFGQQVGTATTNDLSDGSLRAVVARAEAVAKAAAPNTEYVPPPGPQEYIDTDIYDEATASFAHEERAAAIAAAIQPVAGAGLRAAGSYTTYVHESARANSAGLFGHTRKTQACFVQTVVAENSTGWAETNGPSVASLDVPAAAARALRKALTASDPVEIQPGAYTVIFEPAALAGLTSIAGWTMDAKAAHEGRSCWAGKEGTQVGVEALDLRTVPDNPVLPTAPWIQQGLAAREIAWVKDGVLQTLAYDRFWAAECGHEVTGGPGNLVMKGTDASVDDLIADVDRGLLVTRFWYIRFVDPMRLLITGMTRDGLFMVENGEIARGVKNMRFNDSPLRVIKSIRGLAKPEPTTLHGPQVVPPVLVDGFHFTSTTSF